jgi:hypothetical protein
MILTRDEVAYLIERFLKGEIDPWEWENFVHCTSSDSLVKEVHDTCLNLPKKFPPKTAHEYCSEEGVNVLVELVTRLRTEKRPLV